MNDKNGKTGSYTWLDAKNILSSLDKEELLKIIYDLYGISDLNKRFLISKLMVGNLIDQYKAEIKKYFTVDGEEIFFQKIKLNEAKSVFVHYKKITGDLLGTVELMVHYLECAVVTFSQMEEVPDRYYYNLVSVFNQIVKVIHHYERDEIKNWDKRIHAIVDKSKTLDERYYQAVSDILKGFMDDN